MYLNYKKYKVWEIIPTLGGGGAEKMVLDLSKGLTQNGFEVTLISLYDKKHAATNRLKFIRDNNIKVVFLSKKPGFDFRILLKLYKMIKKNKPDIVHTHLAAFQYIVIIRWFLKFNHVHTMHSIVVNETKAYNFLLKIASLTCKTFFVVLSDKIGESLRNTYKTKSDFMISIPNGVDRNAFKPINRKYEQGSVTFITVGSLIPVKNQCMLINAFAHLQKIHNGIDKLYILGEGRLRDNLEKQINRLDLKDSVILFGNVGNVYDYLCKADVFVMTSHYEGVSLALLEAANTGLPIITTSTGNTPEVVKNDAILIEDNDEKNLFYHMKRISDDLIYRREYAQKSINIAERFDKDKMVNSYAKLYVTLIDK